MFCVYGCGQEALFQLKNGKWCCSRSPSSCIVIREKRSKSIKKTLSKPEKRIEMSEVMKKVWENPAKRKEFIEVFIKTQNRPELKEKNKKRFIEDNPMKRPEVASKFKGEKNSMKRPEVLKKISGENSSSKRPEVRIKFLGPNNGNWNPNREEVCAPYTENFFDLELRTRICNEQDFLCPVCKEILGYYRLTLHHIDYIKRNDLRENLVMVHNNCHAKTNYNREFWKQNLEVYNEDLLKR